jgi:hypothetical protein
MKTTSLPALAALVLLLPRLALADFEPKTGWNHQLFPSYLIATAAIRLPAEAIEDYENEQVLGDPQSLLGVTIEAPEDNTVVTVTISCDAIMQPSSCTVTLEESGETYTILPKIKYLYDKLVKHHQPTPISITYTVEIGDETEEQTETLTLRSINDCPFTVMEEGDARDISFLFAAYVNEQHPFVDKMLREALNVGVVDSFTGYQSKDPAEVYRQVYALWHALSERDVRYSDITTSAAESEEVYSQHVRLIDESIGNSQANCVDGSVLLASLLRKVGIEPILVMVPGHCYLAFALDAEGKQIAALETTLISAQYEEATEVDGLDDAVDEDWQEQNSWKTFTAAIAMGNADLKKNAKQFKAETDPDYQLIPVAAARKLGILPIAYESGEAFVSTPAKAKVTPDDDEDEE